MLTKDNLKAMLEALKKVRTDEKLVGNQHKIDANKDGKITGDDFKKLKSMKKESVEEIDTELKMVEAEVAQQTRLNVGKMRNAIKQVWEAALLPQKGGKTPDATMKHVPKSTHANVQNIDNLDKQLDRSKGEKDFVKTHQVDVIDGEKIELDSIDKNKTATKPAPGRKNDQKTGDKAIINKPEDITAKGLGGK